MVEIIKYRDTNKEELLERSISYVDVSADVAAIIDEVKRDGDAALFRLCRLYDKADLSSLEVTGEEIDAAINSISPELLAVIREAAENIRNFHEKQRRQGFIIAENNGIVTGQRIIPLERVGLYVPGGTAAYPSTVLMDAIPAKIAGVGELIMTTPPRPDGTITPAVLAAAKIAGVDRIFKIGGAQAVAALAYGTQSVPRVDKIVGPGNAYVAEAKRQVSAFTSIDMIAGPSEIVIVADNSCNPAFAAADLLSQAEHDKNAAAILITDSEELAVSVKTELERQLALLPRADIARESLRANGRIIITKDICEAVDLANVIAPEHLELCVASPFDWLPKVKNAGSVFLGMYCPEAVGDYFAGANHTLPTCGTARFSSPLSVDDFVKKSQYTYYSREALLSSADKITLFAEAEGLTAHAESVRVRFRKDDITPETIK
ncbi:MAG: histidinol dehydrogenase [Clostridiales bacterium]|nr:histidinol dehydrogenase [Clostridiales bacterium]